MSGKIITQRPIYYDDGVLDDQTINLNDFRAGSFAMTHVSADDYLYIGTDFPFNSKYFDITTANATTASLVMQQWNGSEWESLVDILDFTDTSGVSFAKSGYITWKTDENESGWSRVVDTREEETDFLLTSAVIFRMYWMRMRWSADITATINYIGHKFCNDDELYSIYPDFNNQILRDRWEQGSVAGTKTDWKEQELIASNAIIRDIKSGNIIISDNQILDFELFKDACIHKTAEIIYGGMGSSHRDDETQARKAYLEARQVKRYNVDGNSTGNLDGSEKIKSTGFMRR